MRSGRTDTGLKYVFCTSGRKVGYCSISVKCGTRSENELPEGTAHFLEHTLFKGTARRSASQISSYLDKLGGELNAYTTKEEIVLHATVLKEDIWKAVELLLEIASQATFPEKEVETEKGVVLDEIISYKDSPADDIYDCFESRFFEGHPLGRLTLGTAGSVSGAGPGDLKAFYKRCFVTSAMTLSIVVDEKEEVIEKKALRLAAKYLRSDEGYNPDPFPSIPPQPHYFDIREDKDNHEANVIIGGLAPSLYEEHDRLVAVLLANILGGPASNSLLGAELREKHGWVYGVECGYTQYSDAGLMTISIGCDHANLNRCIKATRRILSRMIREPLSERKLKEAKKQLLGQLAISSDSGENQCLSLGKSMMAFGKISSDKENTDAIMCITAAEIQAMAGRIFDTEKTSTLIFE